LPEALAEQSTMPGALPKLLQSNYWLASHLFPVTSTSSQNKLAIWRGAPGQDLLNLDLECCLLPVIDRLSWFRSH
jgi:hypothetical protein